MFLFVFVVVFFFFFVSLVLVFLVLSNAKYCIGAAAAVCTRAVILYTDERMRT